MASRVTGNQIVFFRNPRNGFTQIPNDATIIIHIDDAQIKFKLKIDKGKLIIWTRGGTIDVVEQEPIG